MTRSARQFNEETAVRGLRIGEVAERSGVGVETLRFYERRGLLGRPARTRAGYRVYDEAALEQLAFIRRGQSIGFSLDEILEIIKESAGGRSPCHEVRQMAHRKLAELDERLRQLRRHRRDLATLLQDWDARGEAPGHVCGLIEHSSIRSSDAAADEGWQRARKGKRR